MAKPIFKFGIVNESLQYYRVSGGAVFTGPDPVYMKPSIIDWASFSLNYKRDRTFHGVIDSYSPDMVRFVKDAAKILRFIKNTQGGAEAIAFLAAFELNKHTQTYDFIDYWQFDFSMTHNQRLYYGVLLIGGGFAARMKAYGSQKYDIVLNDPALAPDFPRYNPMPADGLPLIPPTNNPIPPATPQFVYLDGIPIRSEAQFVTVDNPDGFGFGYGELIVIDGSSPSLGNGKTIGLLNSLTVGDYFSTVGVTNNPTLMMGIGHDAVSDTVIFTASQFTDCKMKIKYNLRFSLTNVGVSSDELILFYNIHKGTLPPGGWGVDVGNTPIVTDAPLPSGGLRVIHWQGESPWFTIPKGYLLSIGFGGSNGSGTLLRVGFPFTSTLNPLPAIILDCSFIPDSSVTRAITHDQLFHQLAAMVATNGGLLDTPYASRSNLLSTPRDPSAPGNYDLDPACTMFTCGDALRGLQTVTITDPYFNGGLPFDQYVQPAINTSLNDFAQDLLTDQCGGIGIEKAGIGTDTLVAEPLYYFYDDNTVIADIGDKITNFEMNDFNDYRASTIIIGQNDQQFDSINGPLETISEVNYTTPITRIIKNTDFKTPYRSDPYGIELIRANLGNKTNVNSSSDNDVIKMQVASTVATPVTVLSNWAGISGNGPTAFNALRLLRCSSITSGLPAELLTPAVGNYAMYNQTFSPQRKALRCLPWFSTQYRGLVDNLMSISGKKKNILLVSDIGSGPVTESNWINVSETAQTYTPPFSSNPITVPPAPIPAGRTTNLIFKPIMFSFTGPAIKGLPLLMTPPGTPGGGKRYGKILFTATTEDGIKVPLAGFVDDIGITPASNNSCNYKLICSPTVEIPDYL